MGYWILWVREPRPLFCCPGLRDDTEKNNRYAKPDLGPALTSNSRYTDKDYLEESSEKQGAQE